jgi:hypothetical protein
VLLTDQTDRDLHAILGPAQPHSVGSKPSARVEQLFGHLVFRTAPWQMKAPGGLPPRIVPVHGEVVPRANNNPILGTTLASHQLVLASYGSAAANCSCPTDLLGQIGKSNTSGLRRSHAISTSHRLIRDRA